MPCPYYHVLCDECRSGVCRAYFPIRQPYIKKDLLPVCKSENYAQECPVYPDAVTWRQEKREKLLEKQCPFAVNNVCMWPWYWRCNVPHSPFDLTVFEFDERGLPRKNEDGEVVLTRTVDDFKETCLTGGPETYKKCPHYIRGTAYYEEYRSLREKAT